MSSKSPDGCADSKADSLLAEALFSEDADLDAAPTRWIDLLHVARFVRVCAALLEHTDFAQNALVDNLCFS